MLELKADQFVALLHLMEKSIQQAERASGSLPEPMIEENRQAAIAIKRACDEIGLTVSSRSSVYVENAKTGKDLSFGFEHVKRTIYSELAGQRFYAPHASAEKYFRQGKLFGDEVWTAFPSANDDIYEAGMCLALDRYTASVMHLMRAVEVGLKALSEKMGVTNRNDWGTYIREVDAEITKRTRAAGARSPDEQFYAEAAASFDHVKRAWRNPSMHVERSYSLDQAEEIFQATRSFMRHLATRLDEWTALPPD